MRYAFANNHISELITDYYLDFYNKALRVQSNYIMHINEPKMDFTDDFFVDKIRRSYKQYAAFSMGETYFERCFTMQNVESIDFCLIRLNTKTKVNTMCIVHRCNSSQVLPMWLFVHECVKKQLALLSQDNPDQQFFMGDITILVDQMCKNKKFLTNGKDGDIFQVCMRSYIDETKKKGSTTLIELDYRELVTRWKALRHHRHPDLKEKPNRYYYKFFRSDRYSERIKRLKGSLSS
jgi:hypothetical protein